MRSTILIGLLVLISTSTSARELKNERRLRKIIPFIPKDKRGTGDTSNHGSNSHSYFTPINAPISGYALGGAAGGLTAGHSNTQGLDSSTGYKGYGGHSLGPGSLSLASLALGSHSGQTYSLPLSYGGHSLISSSKTGPVTFGLQGGTHQNYMAPIYASGVHGLSAYSTGAHSLNLPLLSLTSHGGYSPTTSSSYTSSPGGLVTSGTHQAYSLPISSAIPISQGVSGGLVIAGSHGSSSYGASTPSISSASHASALSSSPSSSSPTYHIGLSSGSPDTSSYTLPISSASYPAELSYQSSSDGSYASSASNSGSATYTFPGTNYGTPTSSSYSSSQSSPNVIYSPSSSSYSGHSSTYNSPSANYGSSGSYSSPSITYSTPSTSFAEPPSYSSHSQASSPYSSSGEQQASYSNVSPMYLSYAVTSYRNSKGDPKYDTLSYSRTQDDHKY